MKKKYLDLFETYGYFKHDGIHENELKALQGYVNQQWKLKLTQYYPHLKERLFSIEIADYHLVRKEVDHIKLWQKRNRLFDKDMVDKVKEFGFIKELQNFFGAFDITEQSYDGGIAGGTEEIYWRIISPNEESDVGGLHADSWFHKLQNLSSTTFNGRQTIKIWLPLYVEPGLNGLLVMPRSHLRNWNYGEKIINRVKYPVLNEQVSPGQVILESTNPGQYLCFGENFLHGGAINRGQKSRVSIEITLSRMS